MAVGILINMPGVTQEQYEQVTTKLFGQYPMRSEDAPDGLLMHSAGPTQDGWYVYDLWESPEQFQRFGEERVGPAMAEVVGAGGPPQPEIYPVHGYLFAR
jgi:hypothetical protein